jgi:hypothetical protein
MAEIIGKTAIIDMAAIMAGMFTLAEKIVVEVFCCCHSIVWYDRIADITVSATTL